MSEAPKKIWLHKGFWDSGDSSYWTDEEGTDPKYRVGNHYIRDDIVNELITTFREWMDTYTGSEEEYRALVKIEDLMFALEKLND